MPAPAKPIAGGSEGGRLGVLSGSDMARIDAAAKSILWQTGITDTPVYLAEKACAAGAVMGAEDRLHLPEALIDNALSCFAKPLIQ